MLKKELWKRIIIAKIMMLLKKIQQNRTKEQEVIQELKKEDGQAWKDDRIVYVDR